MQRIMRAQTNIQSLLIATNPRSLAQALLARKASGGDVAELEAAIDEAVYRLFGVKAEEIGMVEGKEYLSGRPTLIK